MINTIRKHSKWLLYVVAFLVIFSFVYFMAIGPAGNRGNRGEEEVNTNATGEIYGQKITPEMYDRMQKDVDFDFLFSYGQWPEESTQVTPEQLRERTYVRMMLVQKAKQVGVHVTDDQVEKAAAGFLRAPALQRAFGVHDQPVPFSSFVRGVLDPRGLTEDDFEEFVRDDLAVEQLQALYGLPGQLITPQEATNEYIRDNQDYSAQIIFFSASNYLGRVSVTPDDVAGYYTNYMADYRVPDRVQVSYVLFSVTNYLGEALREVGTTNLALEVTNAFDRAGGMQAVPDAKSTNEAMAEIRDILLRHQALQDAATQANTFARSLFAMMPVSPQNLATAAGQSGLTVEHPAPFAEDYGPSEFTAPAAFTQAAFHQLNSDSPISEPIAGPAGVYILALQNNLPSEIPSLDTIRAKVADDLRMRLAIITAIRAGTNFAHQLPMQMATGKSFAAVGFADGLDPLVLPPFSMATQDLPDLENHATIRQLQEVALTTPVGTVSPFMQTDDGGFVLYVESRPPVDRDKMDSEMAEFTAELRERRSEAEYNDWIQHEANRELRSTPLFKR